MRIWQDEGLPPLCFNQNDWKNKGYELQGVFRCYSLSLFFLFSILQGLLHRRMTTITIFALNICNRLTALELYWSVKDPQQADMRGSPLSGFAVSDLSFLKPHSWSAPFFLNSLNRLISFLRKVFSFSLKTEFEALSSFSCRLSVL